MSRGTSLPDRSTFCAESDAGKSCDQKRAYLRRLQRYSVRSSNTPNANFKYQGFNVSTDSFHARRSRASIYSMMYLFEGD